MIGKRGEKKEEWSERKEENQRKWKTGITRRIQEQGKIEGRKMKRNGKTRRGRRRSRRERGWK